MLGIKQLEETDACAKHTKLGAPPNVSPATEISTPDDIMVEQVRAVVSSWLSRNWSEVQEGAYPEMPELTHELQCLLRSPRNPSRK